MVHDLGLISESPSRSVIFDLDGTLIDSQESILTTIKIVLDELGVSAKIPITKNLVGPPLVKTLEIISGRNDQSFLSQAAENFKLLYDTIGYRHSLVYPGVEQLLELLSSRGYNLYIATNKRQVPTQKIIDYFSWGKYFSAAYSIDLNHLSPFKSKSEMISELLKKEKIVNSKALYVGDRVEDYESALENKLACILVGWGYGEANILSEAHMIKVENSNDLLIEIQGLF